MQAFGDLDVCSRSSSFSERLKDCDHDFMMVNYLKGGPSDLGTKIFTKIQKKILVIPKPVDFHS